jgi:hypothetical protein
MAGNSKGNVGPIPPGNRKGGNDKAGGGPGGKGPTGGKGGSAMQSMRRSQNKGGGGK